MLKVALTGGIATGKSYVLEQFRRRGVPCLDADSLAHGVTAAGTEATSAIAARFGQDVLAADGASIAPGWAASSLPTPPRGGSSRRWSTRRSIARFTAGLRAFELLGPSPLAVVDVPLLYETGHAGDFDRVIVTACPSRCSWRGSLERGMSDAEARQRLAAQWPTEEKARTRGFRHSHRRQLRGDRPAGGAGAANI